MADNDDAVILKVVNEYLRITNSSLKDFINMLEEFSIEYVKESMNSE